MNKQDYIDQGMQLFWDGGTLLDPATSWQQKAINEGYATARDEWERKRVVEESCEGMTLRDVAQRQRVLSILGRDMEWSSAQIVERVADTARILVYGSEAKTDSEHARRSHVIILLGMASAEGTGKRGERLVRKALEVAYRLSDSRA